MSHDDKKITPEKSKDAGLALVLICLICFQVWKLNLFMIFSITFLLIAMTYPPIFKPFAKIWFGLSTALGTIVSKIILAILFFGMVLPVGLLRKVLGKDSMRLKNWGKGKDSVFQVRNINFTPEDLEHPY